MLQRLMFFFLAQHIDSILQIIAGVVFTWLGFRRSGKFPTRSVKVFRLCGPALIVIGALLMFKPIAAANWQRLATTDKVASAEFPGAATPKEVTDTIGAVSVKRTTLTYNVPGKDIALFLSSSALPDNARGLTDEQRIESSLAYFATQGSKVLKNETLAGSPVVIHRITLRQDASQATSQMALAYVGGNVYRVVASWTDGQEDQALTDRFVGSFRIASASP